MGGNGFELNCPERRRIMWVKGQLTVYDLTFRNGGNAVFAQGGAVFAQGASSKFHAYRSKFIGNHARQGGAVYWQESSGGYIEDCLFKDNVAGAWVSGGALVVYNTPFEAVRCIFENNNAENGGGLSLRTDKMEHIFRMLDCHFTGNTATDQYTHDINYWGGAQNNGEGDINISCSGGNAGSIQAWGRGCGDNNGWTECSYVNCPAFQLTSEPMCVNTAAVTGPASSTPTKAPTKNPTVNPTKAPSTNPTVNPTKEPTKNPTANPTKEPSLSPTLNPTANPTPYPTAADFIIKIKGFRGTPVDILESIKVQAQPDMEVDLYSFEQKITPLVGDRRLLSSDQE